MTGPDHYRLRDALYGDGVHVLLEVFEVLKETPQGYWVASEYRPRWCSFEELKKSRQAKWVAKNTRIRRCYPTIEEAIASFKCRKESQISRLRSQLEQAEKVLEHFDQVRGATLASFRPGGGFCLGRIPANDYLDFDY